VTPGCAGTVLHTRADVDSSGTCWDNHVSRLLFYRDVAVAVVGRRTIAISYNVKGFLIMRGLPHNEKVF
jgi:hypothetical protein